MGKYLPKNSIGVARNSRSKIFVVAVNMCALVVVGSISFVFAVMDGDPSFL